MEVCCKIKPVKLKKRKKKLIIFLLVFVFLFVGIFIFFKRRINPTILDICTSRIKMITSQALNNAVIESYADFTNLDFVKIDKNSNGDITFVQTNTQTVNALTNSIIDSCNTNLLHLGEEGIEIPTGALLGIPILASAGPNLHLKFVPVGNINYDYETILESSGINQTMHKVYLNIEANVTLVYGLSNPNISIMHQILIGETIIVGEVPDFMLNRP